MWYIFPAFLFCTQSHWNNMSPINIRWIILRRLQKSTTSFGHSWGLKTSLHLAKHAVETEYSNMDFNFISRHSTKTQKKRRCRHLNLRIYIATRCLWHPFMLDDMIPDPVYVFHYADGDIMSAYPSSTPGPPRQRKCKIPRFEWVVMRPWCSHQALRVFMLEAKVWIFCWPHLGFFGACYNGLNGFEPVQIRSAK